MVVKLMESRTREDFLTGISKKVIEVVGGIIRREGKFLLGKRPLGKAQGGHWEFIGGKIEPRGMSAEIITRMNGDLK